jgi:hypothetical protein
MTYMPKYTPEQYINWREMVNSITKDPDIIAYTGWSKGGRGYNPSRFTVRRWSNPPVGMGQHSVHLEYDDGRRFNYYSYCFAAAVTVEEAIMELNKQLTFNQRETKPRSPNRMENVVIGL